MQSHPELSHVICLHPNIR